MTGVIVVECAAFGFTVSEASTKIIFLCTKEMPEATTIYSVEGAGEMYIQTNEFLYLGYRQPQHQSVHRIQRAHTQRMVQLPDVHPRNVRLTERPPRAQTPFTKSRRTRNNVVRLRHVELGTSF